VYLFLYGSALELATWKKLPVLREANSLLHNDLGNLVKALIRHALQFLLTRWGKLPFFPLLFRILPVDNVGKTS